MRLLAIAPPRFGPLELLQREAPDVEIVVGTDATSLSESMGAADAILVAPRFGSVLSEIWGQIPNVRWIHTLAAGVEFLPFDLLRRTEVVVTNSRGLYADSLGEFAIAAMLWFAKDLRRLMRNQEEARWEPYIVERLEGRTVGVIGFGGIGQAVGRRASALGMNILSLRRRQEFGDPTIEEVIADSDYLVISAPLTPATHRLVSSERLAKLKRTAVVINLSRGAIIDEEALVACLRANRIRGAALDVFETEPLPRDHPFWKMDHVLISPHTADQTEDSHMRAMQFFLENLARFERGDSLENVVDKDEQY